MLIMWRWRQEEEEEEEVVSWVQRRLIFYQLGSRPDKLSLGVFVQERIMTAEYIGAEPRVVLGQSRGVHGSALSRWRHCVTPFRCRTACGDT